MRRRRVAWQSHVLSVGLCHTSGLTLRRKSRENQVIFSSTIVTLTLLRSIHFQVVTGPSLSISFYLSLSTCRFLCICLSVCFSNTLCFLFISLLSSLYKFFLSLPHPSFWLPFFLKHALPFSLSFHFLYSNFTLLYLSLLLASLSISLLPLCSLSAFSPLFGHCGCFVLRQAGMSHSSYATSLSIV